MASLSTGNLIPVHPVVTLVHGLSWSPSGSNLVITLLLKAAGLAPVYTERCGSGCDSVQTFSLYVFLYKNLMVRVKDEINKSSEGEEKNISFRQSGQKW